MTADRVHLERRDPNSPLMIHQLIEQGELYEAQAAHRAPPDVAPMFLCTADDVFPWSSCKPDEHFWIRYEATLEVCDSCQRGRYIPSPIRWETPEELDVRLDAEDARLELAELRRQAHA